MKPLILTLCAMLLLCACETNHQYASGPRSNYSQNTGWQAGNDIYKGKAEDKKGAKAAPDMQRMIVYNANLWLTVKKPDSAGKKLAVIAKNYGGYAQTIGTGIAVLRVKAEMLQQALTDIDKLGKVSSRNLFADDVTNAYYDSKMRLDNAMKAREKYLDLLQKAVNVQDILAIEKELDRLNTEIDKLKGQLQLMENQVTYSTITVHLQQRKQPGPLGYVFIGLYKVVKWMFVLN